MRSMHRLPAIPVALFLAFFPVAPLLAQEDGAMEKDQGTMQDHTAMAMGKPSAQGKLTNVGDHKASGTVHLVNVEGKRQLHFTPDFSIEKGPDVYVTLTNGPKPVKGASLTIARLARFSGEQSFELPANIDLGKYSHVVLWCKKYSVSMGQAKLEAAGTGMMGDEGAMKKKDEGAMMDKEDKMGKPATPKSN